MSNLILKKTTTAIFLTIVLVAGTFAATYPSFITGVNAEPYYGMDKDRKSDKKDVSVSSLKCNNINVNVNGLELSVLPPFLGGSEVAAEAVEPNNDDSSFAADNNGDGSQIKDFRFICINNNNNTVIGAEEPVPPVPALLTVKKQVFGCNNIFESGPIEIMDCRDLKNNSTAPWFNCNNSSISNSEYCQSLPENIFDIQVLDDQSTQIQQFKGSEQGTTIKNLDPGTYTVNELKHPTSDNQLGENADAEQDCVNLDGFADGGSLDNTTSNTSYQTICFEYEDEQGNDCSEIALAAGEEKTCIVKNYIRFAFVFI